jgi:drug/metabolite transporter (DMT)-like permease
LAAVDLLQSGELWALASALFWAVAVVLFRRAGEEIPPFALNLFKDVVALALFAVLLVAAGGGGVPDWPARTWALLAVSGVVGITGADSVYFMALNRVGAGLAAVVSCLYFPAIAVQARLVLGEELPLAAFAGGALVLAGVLVGSAGRPLPGTERRDLVVGIALGVLGIALLTSSVILVQPILSAEPVLWTTTVRLLAGTLALVPLVALGPDRPVALRLLRPSPLWRHALPGAVVGGALANVAWIAGFSRAEASVAAILNQLSTIFVFVLAALVLKEPTTMRRVVAVALAFAGALLVIAGR